MWAEVGQVGREESKVSRPAKEPGWKFFLHVKNERFLGSLVLF